MKTLSLLSLLLILPLTTFGADASATDTDIETSIEVSDSKDGGSDTSSSDSSDSKDGGSDDSEKDGGHILEGAEIVPVDPDNLDTIFGFDTDGFNSDGVVISDLGTDDHVFPQDAFISSTNKIVIGGSDANGNFLVASFNEDGTLNTDFNSSGYLVQDMGGYEYVNDIIETSDGNYAMVGTAEGAPFLVVSPTGEIIASAQLDDDSGDYYPMAVLHLNGKYYITGYDSTDGVMMTKCFVSTVTVSGSSVSVTHEILNSNQLTVCSDIKSDSNGNIYLGGYINKSEDSSNQIYDMMLIKYDPESGSHVLNEYDLGDSDTMSELIISEDSAYLIGGKSYVDNSTASTDQAIVKVNLSDNKINTYQVIEDSEANSEARVGYLASDGTIFTGAYYYHTTTEESKMLSTRFGSDLIYVSDFGENGTQKFRVDKSAQYESIQGIGNTSSHLFFIGETADPTTGKKKIFIKKEDFSAQSTTTDDSTDGSGETTNNDSTSDDPDSSGSSTNDTETIDTDENAIYCSDQFNEDGSPRLASESGDTGHLCNEGGCQLLPGSDHFKMTYLVSLLLLGLTFLSLRKRAVN